MFISLDSSYNYTLKMDDQIMHLTSIDSQYNFLTSYDNLEHKLIIMLDNFKPLSNNTSALLDF